MTKDKDDAFWHAIPYKITLFQLANGQDITFTYANQTYTVNTKAVAGYASRPIDQYFDMLERRVIASKPND